MRNLWWDGFFAECADVIWLQYFSLYAVALGAGIGLVGVLAAVSNLVAALALWPGAVLAERTRRYKFLVLATAGGPGRLAFLTLAVIPWIAAGNTALTRLALATVARSLLGNLAMPAWSAFAAEFVPEGMRGRYFSSRNFARQAADFATAPIVGFIIYRLGGLSGWQQAGIFFASFLGPLIGGFLIVAIGYRLVFLFSGAGRLLATLVLWKMVSEAAPEASAKLPKAAPG